MTGPVDYVHVDDIRCRLQALLDIGAEPQRKLGTSGGKLVATVKDPDGNLIGLSNRLEVPRGRKPGPARRRRWMPQPG